MREGLKASPLLTSSVFCSSHDYQSETTFYSAGMSIWERFGSPFRITSGSLLDHLATPHRPFFAKNASPYPSSRPTRFPPVPTPPRLKKQGTPSPIKHDAQASLSTARVSRGTTTTHGPRSHFHVNEYRALARGLDGRTDQPARPRDGFPCVLREWIRRCTFRASLSQMTRCGPQLDQNC